MQAPGGAFPGGALLPPRDLSPTRVANQKPGCLSGQTQILDTSSLLRSCVQSAVGMLRDQHERCQRNVRRVELLLGLLTEEDDCKGEGPRGRAPAQADAAGTSAPASSFALDLAWPKKGRFPSRWTGGRGGARSPARGVRELTSPCFVAATFLQVAKMRLHDLLQKQEESHMLNIKQWVVREASNPDALQEAGTFRYRDQSHPEGLPRGAVTGLPCTCPPGPAEVRAPGPFFL